MKNEFMNYSNYKPETDGHGNMIPTMPGEMYGNSREVYDAYSRGYDDRDISYGSYIAGDHFDEPPTYSTSFHQLHPGVVPPGGPGLSQDDPYGVGAGHPPPQQTPSPPLSDRAYVNPALHQNPDASSSSEGPLPSPVHRSAPVTSLTDNPYGTYNPNNPYGTHQSENPYGTHQSENPYGTHQPENPYGTLQRENPYGTIQPENPYRTIQPENPYGTHQPENPYGTHKPENPYGTYNENNPYGTHKPENPYGTYNPNKLPPASNYNDYMRSMELDEGRSVYVSPKISHQMENLSLTGPETNLPFPSNSGAAPVADPVNYANYADYADVTRSPPAGLPPHPSTIQSQPSFSRDSSSVNPYGTLRSAASQPPHAALDPPAPVAPPPALNHYGTLTSLNHQHPGLVRESPSGQMNHYGTVTSITSSTIANLNNNQLPPTSHSSPHALHNNNQLPPTSHSSPYAQYNGIKEDKKNGYDPRGPPPDSPSSNQSGGPALRQSLSRYPQSSPDGSGSYPLYAGETPNRSSDLRWRDPDLEEVIEYLSHDNEAIRANAAAYLQHLCYKDESTKNKARLLNGIPPLIKLLKSDNPEVCRNACGALRNLSYRDRRHPDSSDDNKRAIKNAEGIPDLVRLLRKTNDDEVRDLITGILWNLSSCEEIKKSIIDDALAVLVSHVVCQYAGWESQQDAMRLKDIPWTDEIRNTSGILRNISSAGGREPAYRRKMRECEGLVESLLHIIRCAIHKGQSQASAHDAISKAPIDNKCVENCMCTLRNLSYRTQEVDDPDYDQPHLGATANGSVNGAGDSKAESSTGCFGAGGKGKREDAQIGTYRPAANQSVTFTRVGGDGGPPKGQELLWHPDTVKPYLYLLAECSNPSTLEAAAGAIQNLCACTWQPAVEIRAAVRKEKGLPFLVELLRIEDDRVVCAVAVALRNLAIDTRNRELIGKYAMRDLVAKIPTTDTLRDQRPSDDTLAAVLSILHEVIKKNSPFAVSLYEANGVEKLVNITRSKGEYAAKVLKLAAQVLSTMWGFRELHAVYRKGGWNNSHFNTKTLMAASTTSSSAQNSGARSPGSGPSRSSPGLSSPGAGGATPPTGVSTLARQNAPRGGDYDDRTLVINRGGGEVNGGRRGVRNEGYSQGGLPQSAPLMPPHPLGEPLYAQVNKQRGMMGASPHGVAPSRLGADPNADPNSPQHLGAPGVDPAQGGDSWV